ncbi:hypothetical protein [Brevundimonas sp. TWP2-3-4b1]|uniref:hypothetical protein n=1 Tax=Brevundimonas sp. TWP2-3-4b1 TaxID=2804580 RepID=UPI003CFA0C8E
MVEPKDIQRLAPMLWGVAGLMFLLAAWLGEQIAFAGIGAMFILLGVSAWLTTRKKDSQ